MSENQPSEHDRQQRLAELQTRLQKLTEERKAELRRSGPLPGDVSPPSAENAAPERDVETPAPTEAVAPAAPEKETAPVAPAVPEASAPQPMAPSPAAAPPADPQPSTPPLPEPLLAGTPRPSAVSAATSVLTARIAMVGGRAKRAVQALGRPATAKARARKKEGPPRQPRAQPRPDSPVAGEEPAERPTRKKGRSLRAAALVGFGLIGGVAFMQFADLEWSELLDGALPAAETNDGGSQPANAAGSTLPVENPADPLTVEPLQSGSVLDDAIGPVETVPAEIWAAPPVLEISSPDATDVTAVEVDLALLEPAASEPTPITSSSALAATGNPTERPTFIPYDVPPKLENPGEIQKLLERGYPSQLRDAGIEGTVLLWIFVDEQGVVQKTEVKESSGYEVMDEAALSTAEKMRFSPAMNRDKATPVWLSLPITFR